jgi:hypothetical protein
MSFYFRILLTILLIDNCLVAQPNKILTNKDDYNWMLGGSWLLLDDDGNASKPFNFAEYHFSPFPTRILVDKYLYNGWSIEGSIFYQKYDKTKLVNDSIGVGGSMFGLDVHSKYSFYKFLGKGWIDPYLIAGGGITSRILDDRNTAKSFSLNGNFGGGINFWVSYNVGIQLQSLIKVSLTDIKGTSHYMAHSAGVVIRLEKSNGESNEFAKSKYNVKKSRTKIKLPKGNKNRKET